MMPLSTAQTSVNFVRRFVKISIIFERAKTQQAKGDAIMARGSNPNSRANLSKGKMFDSASARKAQIKSAEAHNYNCRFREAGKEALTDDALKEIWQAMIKRAKQGNIAAFKAMFDIMGEAKQTNSDEPEIRLAFIAEMSPPESPPDDIELIE